MLEEKIAEFYDELEKTYSLNKRDVQRKGSLFFALPLYGESVCNVVGEGKTGMGKTLSYLVPVAMARLKELPALPRFVLRDPKKYLVGRDVSSREKIEALFEEYAEEKNYEVDAEAELESVTPTLERVFIVTATKMLQNQIVEKDLATINDFIERKGGNPFNFAVTIGKKNYVCKSQLEKLLEKIRKKLEEVSEVEKQAKGTKRDEVVEFKKEVENAKEMIERILSVEEVSSLDDVLRVLGYESYQKLISFIEDYEGVESVYAPSTVKGLGNVLFEKMTLAREDVKGFYGAMKKAYRFLEVEEEGISKCAKCSFSRCSYKSDVLSLQKADLVIMNYHYFASVFLKKMAFVTACIKGAERFLGMKVDSWKPESLKKELEKLLAGLFGESSGLKKEVDWLTETLLKLKGYYERNVKNAYFIFDEAHNFEKDLLSSFTRTFDFQEFCKLIEKIKVRLAGMVDRLEVFSAKGVFANFFESLLKATESFVSFDRVTRKVFQELKEKWKEGEDTENILKEFAVLFTENFFRMAFVDKKLQSFLVRQILGNEELDDSEVKKVYEKCAEEFKKVLSSESRAEKELICLSFLGRVIDGMERILEISSRLYARCKEEEKIRAEKGEVLPLETVLLTRKFPSSAFKNALKECCFLSEFIKIQFLTDLQKEKAFGTFEVKEFEKRMKEERSFVSSVFNDFYGSFPVGLLKKVEKGEVSTGMEGFTWYVLEKNVDTVLNNAFFDWKKVRKAFTSATIVDDYEKITQGTKGMSFFLKGVGLEKVSGKSILTFVSRSPFDYEKNARLYVPEDVPDVRDFEKAERTSSGWKEYLLENMKEYPFYVKGGTLVLLTSRELLWWLYQNLKDYYRKEGIRFYAQGIHSMREITKNFGKKGEPQVLLSAGVFWQGFDVPGEGLQNVIIPRLPFDEPSSPYNTLVLEKRKKSLVDYLVAEKGVPLTKALEVADKYVFQKYVLPRAVLTFRQGMGRLIRTEEDKGIVIVLDRRLLESGYGKRFQEFIPMPIIRKKEVLRNFLIERGIAGRYFTDYEEREKDVKREDVLSSASLFLPQPA